MGSRDFVPDRPLERHGGWVFSSGRNLALSRREMLAGCACAAVLSMFGCGAPSDDSQTYYENHEDAIRGELEAMLPFVRKRLEEAHGETVADAVIKGTRSRIDELLPDVPYIGGDGNELTRNLYQCSMVLALHLEMRERGHGAADTAEVVYRAFADYLAEMPQSLLLGVAGWLLRFTHPDGTAEYAASNPHDWAYVDVPGDGVTYDYGVDYNQCGICTYIREHDASEILPYLCLLDFPVFKAMGIGLERTMTLAHGDGVCDFRHNFDGRYSAEWEPFELGL